MSIRPVDMQVLLPRAVEVARMAQQDGNRAENQNSQFADQFQKTVNQESKQVVNASQAHEANINKDGRSGDKYQQNRKRKETEKEEEAKTKVKNQAQGRGLVDYRV